MATRSATVRKLTDDTPREIVKGDSPPQQGPSVTQDNALIQAAYTMTLDEKRLLWLGLSKIDPLKQPRVTQPLNFRITVDEWCRYYPSDSPYKQMQEAAAELAKRQVLHPKKPDVYMNWTDTCTYKKREGYVEIQFGYTISTFLAGMVEQFTKYDLLSVSKLTSFYSIRVYELCSQFKSTGYRKIAVEELRHILQVKDSYKLFADFRKWVIEAACKEITKKSDYTLTYEAIKEGRAVKYIAFHFHQKRQMDLLDDSK